MTFLTHIFGITVGLIEGITNMNNVKCRDCACADIINEHLASCLSQDDYRTYDPDKKRFCRWFEAKSGVDKQPDSVAKCPICAKVFDILICPVGTTEAKIILMNKAIDVLYANTEIEQLNISLDSALETLNEELT